MNQKFIRNLKVYIDDPKKEGKVFSYLSNVFDDSQYESEPSFARGLMEFIEESLGDKMKYAYNDEVFNFWMGRLFWQSLPAMPRVIIDSLGTENLLYSLENYDVLVYIKKFFKQYEFGLGPEKDLRNGLIKNLESNTEVLGQNTVSLGKEKFSPSLQNWIKLYNFSVAGDRSDKFKKIVFLQKDKSVSVLTIEEKKVLKQLLDIYDWLKFPPRVPEITDKEEPGYIKSQRFILPKGNFAAPNKNLEIPIQTIEPKSVQPEVKKLDIQEVLNQSSGIKMSSPRAEILKEKETLGSTVEAPKFAVPVKTAQSNPKDPLADITKQIEEKKRLAQEEINKKLESLRQRKGNKP